MDLRSGSQRHRHFVWPVQAPTRGHRFSFLYDYTEKPPHLIAFYDTLGIRRTHSRPPPAGPYSGVPDLLFWQKYVVLTNTFFVLSRELSNERLNNGPLILIKVHWLAFCRIIGMLFSIIMPLSTISTVLCPIIRLVFCK